MALSREELEALDRDTLIREAEKCGVGRARIMTRPELVDEILLARAENRAEVKKARGFFGLARDLLFRAVERGLNLPDAQERFRGVPNESRPRVAGEVIPTVTLAEIYAAQGHTKRAIETLRGVLSREPDHAAAHALLEELEDESYEAPPPPALPPEDDAAAERATLEDEADDVPTPPRPVSPRSEPKLAAEAEPQAAPQAETNGIASAGAAPSPTEKTLAEDLCFAVPDGDELRVTWDLRLRSLTYHKRLLPQSSLVLRAAIIAPNVHRPRRSFRDIEVDGASGSYRLSGLPPGVVVRVAIGMLASGAFFPLAHGPAIERDGDELYVWTPTGKAPLPPRIEAAI